MFRNGIYLHVRLCVCAYVRVVVRACVRACGVLAVQHQPTVKILSTHLHQPCITFECWTSKAFRSFWNRNGHCKECAVANIYQPRPRFRGASIMHNQRKCFQRQWFSPSTSVAWCTTEHFRLSFLSSSSDLFPQEREKNAGLANLVSCWHGSIVAVENLLPPWFDIFITVLFFWRSSNQCSYSCNI